MIVEYDEIVVLDSGTELSIEAALGDLERAREALEDEGLKADLDHVSELLRLLAS